MANLIALKYQKEWVASNEQRCKVVSDKKKVSITQVKAQTTGVWFV